MILMYTSVSFPTKITALYASPLLLVLGVYFTQSLSTKNRGEAKIAPSFSIQKVIVL